MRITPRLRNKFRFIGKFGTLGRRKAFLTQVNKHPMCRAYIESSQLLDYIATLTNSNAQTVRVQVHGVLTEILTSHEPPKKAKCWLIITSETPYGTTEF